MCLDHNTVLCHLGLYDACNCLNFAFSVSWPLIKTILVIYAKGKVNYKQTLFMIPR